MPLRGIFVIITIPSDRHLKNATPHVTTSVLRRLAVIVMTLCDAARKLSTYFQRSLFLGNFSLGWEFQQLLGEILGFEESGHFLGNLHSFEIKLGKVVVTRFHLM